MNGFAPPLKGRLRAFFKPPRGAARRKRKLRGAAVKRRQAGFGKAVERLPPALAVRLGARDDARSSEKWVKTWRTVPMAFGAIAARPRVQSVPGSAAMPPSRPLAGRRTSQT